MTDRSDKNDSQKVDSERWTLVAMILCSGVVCLQSTVINVALSNMGRALDAHLSGLQWIVDGHFLALSALLILGGSLGIGTAVAGL